VNSPKNLLKPAVYLLGIVIIFLVLNWLLPPYTLTVHVKHIELPTLIMSNETVEIEDSDGNVIRTGQTNNKGIVKFSLPKGSYVVTFVGVYGIDFYLSRDDDIVLYQGS